MRNGAVIEEEIFDADFGGTGDIYDQPLVAGDTLEVVGCGGVAIIPLDVPQPPAPTVAAYVVGEALIVSWNTQPPGATTLVSVNDGFVRRPCHRLGGEGSTSVPLSEIFDSAYINVHAFAPVKTYDTTLGVAHVWRGGREIQQVTIAQP